MPLLKHKSLGKKTIIEFSGAEMTAAEAKILRRLQPAGVMFRKRNFKGDIGYEAWLSAYQKLQADVRNEIKDSRIIFCVDHEGGKIVRFPPPITRFPYQFYWPEDQISRVASVIALELKSLGINFLLGPALDVWSNPSNQAIADRAFAKEPDQVISRAAVFFKSFAKFGIVTCPKHFPGHGGTVEDSHFVLPKLDSTLDELRACELLPFKMAINFGTPCLMSAHIWFPKIDQQNPTTYSKIFMDDLLRKELGFKGVLMTDALAMAAVTDRGSDQFVSKLSSAMVDIALFVGNDCRLEEAVNFSDNLEMLVQRDKMVAQEVEDSLERIDKLLSGLKSFDCVRLPEAVLEEHNALAKNLSSSSLLSGKFGIATDKF
ncbi:MAG TPA: glycoside hydrolase family 3 N-terminal domain-containing protein [Oligoflexia bacterium]|nr:glycoside hydrolase family 3 N-terminal domain-containing protein [Oligoflexia bacterium]HMP27579.1 glycoside hydrolase family 3 N-terminal domain-containing protein [Oligoflexia bacterium]